MIRSQSANTLFTIKRKLHKINIGVFYYFIIHKFNPAFFILSILFSTTNSKRYLSAVFQDILKYLATSELVTTLFFFTNSNSLFVLVAGCIETSLVVFIYECSY